MKRGFTLVEQMITVALIGISGVAIDALSIQTERAGLAELQRARAGVLLEYHARRASTGLPPEPSVVSRLTESLPEATVERVSEGNVVTLTATWRAPSGPETRRVLTVFSGGKR
jgi:prepilin-type N-terminal cleavage/methylation domain-containing protein